MSVVILLAMQRSGTQALGSVLDQHSSIEYLGEVFHDKHIDRPGNYFGFLKNRIVQDVSLAFPDQAPERFKQYLAYLDTIMQKDISVLDVKYASTHHFEKYWKNPWAPPFFLQLLASHQIPVIHLTRRNLFRQYISNLMAETTNVWNLKQSADVPPAKVTINTATCISEIEMRENHARLMAQYLLNCPHVLSFDYADLFESGKLAPDIAGKLALFLKVAEFENLKPVFLKQTPETLEDIILNMEEVEMALRRSRFAWMLDA